MRINPNPRPDELEKRVRDLARLKMMMRESYTQIFSTRVCVAHNPNFDQYFPKGESQARVLFDRQLGRVTAYGTTNLGSGNVVGGHDVLLRVEFDEKTADRVMNNAMDVPLELWYAPEEVIWLDRRCQNAACGCFAKVVDMNPAFGALAFKHLPVPEPTPPKPPPDFIMKVTITDGKRHSPPASPTLGLEGFVRDLLKLPITSSIPRVRVKYQSCMDRFFGDSAPARRAAFDGAICTVKNYQAASIGLFLQVEPDPTHSPTPALIGPMWFHIEEIEWQK